MRCVWEHNGNDTLLYAADYIGAYTRGESLEIAIAKMQTELDSYSIWCNQSAKSYAGIEIVQEKCSNLQIADADSDILFDTETAPLTQEEYEELKALVLKSAADFYTLYSSIPNKNESSLPKRKTFYGNVPRTAQEMYEHTKNVNAYYFGEIGIDVDNAGTIWECRNRGFALLEQSEGYLDNPTFEGSYGELWSLRKMMRRFLWHDRIHAKAMWRMSIKTFGLERAENSYKFTL
mgnify:CR=1 FL=1